MSCRLTGRGAFSLRAEQHRVGLRDWLLCSVAQRVTVATKQAHSSDFLIVFLLRRPGGRSCDAGHSREWLQPTLLMSVTPEQREIPRVLIKGGSGLRFTQGTCSASTLHSKTDLVSNIRPHQPLKPPQFSVFNMYLPNCFRAQNKDQNAVWAGPCVQVLVWTAWSWCLDTFVRSDRQRRNLGLW